MNIAVVGSGYVGLVSGTCYAESGNEVFCVDINAERIAQLNEGKIPIYEPGLEELVRRNIKEGRLHFTTDITEAIKQSMVSYIAVGTPMSASGAADLSGDFQGRRGHRQGDHRLSHRGDQEHGAGRHQRSRAGDRRRNSPSIAPTCARCRSFSRKARRSRISCGPTAS